MDIAHPRDLPAIGAAVHLTGNWTRALPVLVAVLGTLGTFFAVQAWPGEWPSADGRLYTLLWERGFTQPLTLGLFFWGLGHVLRRMVVQAGERRALVACRQMRWEGPVRREELPGRLEALARLRDSLAGDVLYAVFSYFRTLRPTRDEVLDAAQGAVDRAHDRIEDAYKPLGAVMWLLPLSGFLGTVVGMAGAIASFDAVLAGVGDDLSALMPAVAGLAVAFDTTLLALALVVPLKLFETALEGRDRRLLDRIERDLGAGYVQTLDLAGLAQQTPEAQALQRYAEAMERIERSLLTIDRALGHVADQLGRLPGVTGALDEMVGAAQETRAALPRVTEALDEMVGVARDTRAALPHIRHEVAALRAQADRPLILQRAGGALGRAPAPGWSPTGPHRGTTERTTHLPDDASSSERFTIGDETGPQEPDELELDSDMLSSGSWR